MFNVDLIVLITGEVRYREEGFFLESDRKNKVSPNTDPGNESDAPCADCGKKFKRKSNLDRHRVTLVLDTPLVAYVENGLLT